MSGAYWDIVDARMLYYGIPHYLFLLIYTFILCKYRHNARFGHRTTSLPCTYKCKFTLNIICCAFCLFFTFIQIQYIGAMSLIQLIFCVAWVCSAHLLKFSYDRAIPLTWPHRLYWVSDFIIIVIFFTFEMVSVRSISNSANKSQQNRSFEFLNSTYFMVLMIINLVFLLMLSVLAIRCPKDFFYSASNPLLPTRHQTNESVSLLDEKEESLTARIFQQSVNSQSGEVLFCIRTFEAGRPLSKKIKKTLQEFRELDQTLHFKYQNQIEDSSLILPSLPSNNPSTFNDYQLAEKHLNRYLAALLSGDNHLTKETLDFLEFIPAKRDRILQRRHEINSTLLAQRGASQVDGVYRHRSYQTSQHTLPETFELKKILRRIWEKEEILQVEMIQWMLEPAQQRIIYMLRVSYSSTVAGHNYNNAFQTEISLLEMQRLDRRLRERNLNSYFPPLPEEDLVYKPRSSREYEIDKRFAIAARDQICDYLTLAFNDPSYYCSSLFKVVGGFRPVSHLKPLASLFDGSLAAREKALRESWKSAPQELKEYETRSYQPRNNIFSLQIENLNPAPHYGGFLSMNTRNLGIVKSEWAVAGTGQLGTSHEEVKEESEADSTRQIIPEEPGVWWDSSLNAIFEIFVGIRFQIHVKDSKVSLGKTNSLQFLYSLEVQRFALPFQNLLQTWKLEKTNLQILELDTHLELRFGGDYTEECKDLELLRIHLQDTTASNDSMRVVSQWFNSIVHINGLMNSSIVRKFFSVEHNKTSKEEDKDPLVGTQQDYFGTHSLALSELESHHESLRDSPGNAMLPQYFA